MTAGASLRRLLLTLHIASSVGLLGAVAAFLLLAAIGVAAAKPGIYLAMNLITVYLIVPLAWASLLIGMLQSSVSPWGLTRHYWVVIKLGLTATALVVLLLQTETIELLSDLPMATLLTPDWTSARSSMVLHAGGGLLVLLLATVLSVYKPRGLTPYGWNRRGD
ncbi:hypothetical protein [Devosia neptuniae]|uniref:hypothetical protein n=1 Tax=Devosia neptuniae TaxID=191302 RepID=UPI0022AE984B|nr:hypothetical protein [Devosia neptuniae]MCZ4348105.1 hypothetical protein [Devosia neptuniae]